MSQLLLKGGRHLDGEVQIQGAKNSVLPILAATLLTGDAVELKNCPRLKDVDASVRILQTLGCDAHWEAEKPTVNAAQLSSCAISDTLMREMRSSAIFLGAILARCGRAEISYPGWLRSVMGPSLRLSGKERGRSIVRTVSVRTMLLWRG
ncbi:MAG: UDP-N-acetylglucosamine 1-carboxyvinyltransferase [Oscillospiraceae bacterium]